jgi:NACalpha-BTF3-like transcription factor
MSVGCPRDKVVAQRRNIMKRRTMLMLMLLGLGIASFPQVASAQSSPLIGTWKLNVEKSKSDKNNWISTEDAIERLMQTAGCSRRQASKALSTFGSLAFKGSLWSMCGRANF